MNNPPDSIDAFWILVEILAALFLVGSGVYRIARYGDWSIGLMHIGLGLIIWRMP